MLERIRHFASGRNVLIALLVLVIALPAMNVAATLFYKATGGYGILDLGGGANLFDDRGSYTPAHAYMLIAHYGRIGIHRYYRLLIADTFFPPIIGTFALLTIAWALGRIAPRRRWPYLLLLIPIAYTMADWSENLGILTMLLNYPHEMYGVAAYTDFMRAAKNLLADTSLLLAIATWLLTLWPPRLAGR